METRLRSNRAERTADSNPSAEQTGVERYFRAEWDLFANDPNRSLRAREAVAAFPTTRVLDIGCGAGQELRPFVADGRSFGIGIDLSPFAGVVGRSLYAAERPQDRVAFVRGTAEHLPFGASVFELAICRLALPYTDNARMLSEVARVLEPGGAFILKFHHARYYFQKLRAGLSARLFKSAIHACRVLLAGTLYHATGAQPRGRLIGKETFQTMWLLRRELARCGMEIRRLLPEDSVPAAPCLLIVKQTRNST